MLGGSKEITDAVFWTGRKTCQQRRDDKRVSIELTL